MEDEDKKQTTAGATKRKTKGKKSLTEEEIARAAGKINENGEKVALKDELETYSIRLRPEVKQRLTLYFREKYDLTFAAGMRVLLEEYMRTHRI
jgi:hypothetical protein